MLRAIDLSIENVTNGGGPFAALVVRGDEIIASGVNRVTATNDPTAHAEIVAIREACAKLQTFQLEGCHIYTTCEPCPMCLGAIYWSRAARVFYANTREDAREIGFDDDFIYREIATPLNLRAIPMIPLLRDHALRAFRLWRTKPDKQPY
ncbi:MAG: nucleoside deaminase [Bryobacteraceae bacterium]